MVRARERVGEARVAHGVLHHLGESLGAFLGAQLVPEVLDGVGAAGTLRRCVPLVRGHVDERRPAGGPLRVAGSPW